MNPVNRDDDAHVTARLAARLGNETDPAETAAIDAHLAACTDCRAEAEALRGAWETLDAGAAPVSSASVWPAVRARTTGRRVAGTGLRPLWRGAAAAAAVVAGLVLGNLAPAGVGAVSGDEEDVAAWLEGSSWRDEEALLVTVWLDVAAAEEETP